MTVWNSRRARGPLACLLALGLAASAGCARGERDPSGTKVVELWTMQLKPNYTEFIGERLKDFESAHPGVRVEWVDLPANEIENKTLTAAAGGKAPDLVNLNPAFANKLANARALAPLELTPAFKAQYFDAAWRANTVNGEVVGIPWYLSTSVTLYNTELWKQAGLKVGEWPATYRALGEASRAIKAKTQAHGFMPHFGDRGKFMELLAQEGVPLLGPDGKSAGFNTPKGAEVLAFWAGLIREGVVPRESLTQGHREAIDRFQAGQTAVFPAGPQFLTMIRENSPQLLEKLAVGPQLTGASGKVGVGVMNLVVPKASDQQALALELAKHLTSGENQLAFSKLVPILPSVKSAAEDPYFKADAQSDLTTRARALAAAQLQRAELLVPPLPRQSELAKSLDGALQRAALGQQTPEAALEQAAAEWRTLLAR